MTELLPCPFCGTDSALQECGSPNVTRWIECGHCDATGPDEPGRGSWNRRAPAPGWIPIGERLPEEGQDVLCVVSCTEPGLEPFIDIAFWDGFGEWVVDRTCAYPEHEVTHWMPLPAEPAR